MAYPRHQRSRSFKFATRTAGDLTTASTTYADVSTALDIVLGAQAGDVIEYGVLLNVAHSANFGVIGFEVYIIVSAAPVNPFGGAADGAWRKQPPSGGNMELISGSLMYTLLSGDISAGTVTCRLRWKTVAATPGTITLSADGTNRRATVWAKNLGPASPH
jgi:hypothetical protein